MVRQNSGYLWAIIVKKNQQKMYHLFHIKIRRQRADDRRQMKNRRARHSGARVKKGRAMADPAFSSNANPIKPLSPFVFLFMLFLQVSGRVFFYMLSMMNVGFVRFQFNVHIITQADPEVARQRCTHLPMITFYVKVYFSSGIVIYRASRIIPVLIFCTIPVSRGMRGRAAFFMLMASFRISRIALLFIRHVDPFRSASDCKNK